MKLSVLPTLNRLVLALDHCDQAIADLNADKVHVTIGDQQSERMGVMCKRVLLADLNNRRSVLVEQIRACGVEFD